MPNDYTDFHWGSPKFLADTVLAISDLDKLTLLETMLKQRRRVLEQRAIDQAGKLLAEAA